MLPVSFPNGHEDGHQPGAETVEKLRPDRASDTEATGHAQQQPQSKAKQSEPVTHMLLKQDS